MNRQTLMHDLTLMLLSLTSWEEGKGDVAFQRAWKGYDFDVLDELRDEGFVAGKETAKSVAITSDGINYANELFERYGIALDPEPQPQRFFRLRLSFRFTDLTCMRTIMVPEHTTFEDFHTMIQACLNWKNYHLYDFALKSEGKELFIAWPDYETGEDPRPVLWTPREQLPQWINSATTYLDDYLPKTKKMLYSYDYGDGWEIDIELINRGEKLASDVPVCWEGSGEAPPEDVGGEGGFIDFLDAFSNPTNPEYRDALLWGVMQGFERFSTKAANKRLARWQEWERCDINEMPMEAQLKAFGKIISKPKQRIDTQAVLKRLARFEANLKACGLSAKTVRTHMDNVAFFSVEYLAEQRGLSIEEGVDEIAEFMDHYLIRKNAWTSKTFMKSMATSIKKLYQYLADTGEISKQRNQEVRDLIRDNLADWIADFEAFEKESLLNAFEFRLIPGGNQ